MIRYATLPDKTPISLATLRAAVEADATSHPDAGVRKAVKDWLDKSDLRTAQLLSAKSYTDLKKWEKLPAARKAVTPKPIAVDWSDVKYLFMSIQNDKCAYCERKLASQGDGGAAEHDLEHFRTKNPVKAWSAPKEIDFPTGGAIADGYYWLAFHLLNYCTACKKCNSGFKSNFFPIGGKSCKAPDEPSPALLSSERPFLIYPLGDLDEDPEDLVRFRGLVAFPPAGDPLLKGKARTDAHRNRRARVVIAFFDLNHREELLWGRAERLRNLEKALTLINTGSQAERRHAEDDLRRMTNGFSEHTACIRAMIRLYQNDLKTARKLFQTVRKYLDSKTPKDYSVHMGRFEPKKYPKS